MPLEFGTDGVRGVANAELTPELVVALGRAAARVLGRDRWLVGRDTRISGPLLQAALTAGLAAEGAGVADVGVLPTPAVAFLSEQRAVPAAVISASHNPFPDNGIKLFAAGGRKLTDDVEARLEHELATSAGQGPHPGNPTGAGVGRLSVDADPIGPYAAHLATSLDGRRLDGLRLVLDCAHGAASGVAPLVFGALGAQLTVLHAEPDGTNINAGGGSTHPEALQHTVVREGADAGLAFDGDADRVLAVDHTGAVVDGDHLLALCAIDRHQRGILAGDAVVVTVMTNLGFRLAMAERGIRVVETAVGDRYVLEALESQRLTLGGEQSGHLVFRGLATTGDGLLTGLQVLDVAVRRGKTLAELAGAAMTRLPQVLRSVRVADRDGLEQADAVWKDVAAVQAALGERGRVLLRPSGTEPLVRVMVEAPTQAEAEAAVDRLCDTVAAALGSSA